ncbi:MAG TPA: chorismate mutase [Actinomycetota bacterium]|nr:chorismate mutase [Actinomycetota bacterium]
MRLRGFRGATTVPSDTKEEVVAATRTLLEEMLRRNDLPREDLVSIIFTATPDLRSEFPAVAARSMGVSDVPLLCARELDIEGAMPRCIRVLLHAYSARPAGEIRHVYLGEARALRDDLPE